MLSRKDFNDLVNLRFFIMKTLLPEVSRTTLRPLLAKKLKKDLANSHHKDSVIETLRENKKLVGVFLLVPGSSNSMVKQKEQWQLSIFYNWRNKKAFRWARKMITKYHQQMKCRSIDGQIGPYAWPLLSTLEANGFSVDTLLLVARVKTALAKVSQTTFPNDISARPILKKDINKVLKITKEEFTRNPQFGALAADPSFLKFYKNLLLQNLKLKKDSCDFVLINGGKVVGTFGHSVVPQGIGGRKTASVGLTFGKEIQRRGLARPAYSLLLRSLRKYKVHFLIGGTSQLPVMKLSAEQGRFHFGFCITNKSKFFPKEYFLKYPIWPKALARFKPAKR